MTKEKKIELIQKWIDAGKSLSDSLFEICNILKITPESPMHTAPWDLFDVYTDTLAEILGDENADWLIWFAFECSFGAKAKEMIFPNGETLLVVGASDLYAAIDSDENGNRKW
jgi:hypothetical protein